MANLVVLLDGRSVASDSEDWRLECRDRETEARLILARPNIEDRRAAIERYGLRMGAEARSRLEEVIKLLWQYRRR